MLSKAEEKVQAKKAKVRKNASSVNKRTGRKSEKEEDAELLKDEVEDGEGEEADMPWSFSESPGCE
jgi:hypothetical protein